MNLDVAPDLPMEPDQFIEVTPEMAEKLQLYLDKAKEVRIKAESALQNLKERAKEDRDTLAKLGIDTENPEQDIALQKKKASQLYQEISADIPYKILDEVK